MAKRIAVIVLLVEDLHQDMLLRCYLRCRGQVHNVRSQMLPKGRGSGEQFVRERYASEVRAIRSQLARTRACLIAMIDADTESVQHRRQQLEGALRHADASPRGPAEPILNPIPKRNVETWVLCLNAEPVDEIADYRRDRRIDPETIRQAANTLHSWTRANVQLPDTCVPSLRECLPEFRRVPGDE